LRAFTAAKLYQRGEFKSLVTAANGCGSNPQYVKAALILKRTNNTVLVNDVLFGDRPLVAAAKAAERLAALIEAYRAASSSDLAQFGETVGGEEVFNSVVAPAL
jgi:hypothetical protein